jgi:hypothetical protein
MCHAMVVAGRSPPDAKTLLVMAAVRTNQCTSSFSREHRPEKTALVADDATGIFRVLEGSLAFWVLKRLGAVFLVQRQAWEGEHRQGNIVGPLGWQEVTMVFSTESFNQWNPDFPVVLKFMELERVDGVTQIAGNHGFS